MRKIIVAALGICALVSIYSFVQRHVDEKMGSATVTYSVTNTLGKEIVESTGSFVEKRGTFFYNNKERQYLLIVPAGYAQNTAEWPLIFFLHGSSLRGQKLDKVKEYGPTWVAEQKALPFVILSPQCPEGEDWEDDPAALIALLNSVIDKYRIDKRRIYLTGVSMGGRATWDLASRYPECFAAVAPLAAKPALPGEWKSEFISMPVWAFHGDQDDICPLKDDAAMIDALRAKGGNPRLTILSGQGHYIAGVYKNQELYDWFLSNRR